MQKIAYLGIGIMGRGMVGNLPGFADALDDAADDDLFGARVDELVLDG